MEEEMAPVPSVVSRPARLEDRCDVPRGREHANGRTHPGLHQPCIVRRRAGPRGPGELTMPTRADVPSSPAAVMGVERRAEKDHVLRVAPAGRHLWAPRAWLYRNDGSGVGSP